MPSYTTYLADIFGYGWILSQVLYCWRNPYCSSFHFFHLACWNVKALLYTTQVLKQNITQNENWNSNLMCIIFRSFYSTTMCLWFITKPEEFAFPFQYFQKGLYIKLPVIVVVWYAITFLKQSECENDIWVYIFVFVFLI